MTPKEELKNINTAIQDEQIIFLSKHAVLINQKATALLKVYQEAQAAGQKYKYRDFEITKFEGIQEVDPAGNLGDACTLIPQIIISYKRHGGRERSVTVPYTKIRAIQVLEIPDDVVYQF